MRGKKRPSRNASPSEASRRKARRNERKKLKELIIDHQRKSGVFTTENS